MVNWPSTSSALRDPADGHCISVGKSSACSATGTADFDVPGYPNVDSSHIEHKKIPNKQSTRDHHVSMFFLLYTFQNFLKFCPRNATGNYLLSPSLWSALLRGKGTQDGRIDLLWLIGIQLPHPLKLRKGRFPSVANCSREPREKTGEHTDAQRQCQLSEFATREITSASLPL